MGFPRQEYWSGLLFPSPGDLPNPGIGLTSPALAGRFFTAEPLEKPPEGVVLGSGVGGTTFLDGKSFKTLFGERLHGLDKLESIISAGVAFGSGLLYHPLPPQFQAA